MFFWRIARCLLTYCVVGLAVAACSSSSSGQEHGTPTSVSIPATIPSPTENIPTSSTPQLTYQGHQKAIVSVVWSPDGTKLASASDDGTVQEWSAGNGKTLWVYNDHNYEFAVAWSPDGQHIAAGGGDGTVTMFDATTGHLIATYGSPSSYIEGLAWSPDSKKIAEANQDGTVKVWNAATGKLLLNYTGHTDAVNEVAWSPDGRRIASTSHDGTVRVWDAATGQTDLIYRGHMAPVWVAVWSPDGKYIASGTGAAGTDSPVRANNSVRVWDANTGRTLLTYTEHGSQHEVYGLAWSPDGTRIASGSDDFTVRIWNAMTGQTYFIYRGHTDLVASVAWSPDGTRIASGSQDATIQLWQPEP